MPSSLLNLAISGAAGRMGNRLIDLGSQDSEFKIVGAIEASDHPRLGQDAGLAAGIGELCVPFSNAYPENVDVVIDFSHPPGACGRSARCSKIRRPARRGIVQYVRRARVEVKNFNFYLHF